MRSSRHCLTEYDPRDGFTYHCLHCGYMTRSRTGIINHCATCHGDANIKGERA